MCDVRQPNGFGVIEGEAQLRRGVCRSESDDLLHSPALQTVFFAVRAKVALQPLRVRSGGEREAAALQLSAYVAARQIGAAGRADVTEPLNDRAAERFFGGDGRRGFGGGQSERLFEIVIQIAVRQWHRQKPHVVRHPIAERREVLCQPNKAQIGGRRERLSNVGVRRNRGGSTPNIRVCGVEFALRHTVHRTERRPTHAPTIDDVLSVATRT
jgi:hypothetical protein